MKKSFFTSALLVTLLSFALSAGEKIKETEFMVFGNCGMCKTRIEKALKISEVKFAKWDKKSKMVKVAYLADKISIDSLQQRLAAVGHDTEKFKAADDVYKELPPCCLYRGGANTH